MATGCKPVDLRVYAGSNPAPSTLERIYGPKHLVARAIKNIDNEPLGSASGSNSVVES